MSKFEGTIIDIETIGEFHNRFQDSRRYKNIIPVIIGYINGKELKIISAKEQSSIDMLKGEIIELLPKLEEPFYAFNSDFERGVLYHFLETPIKFRELNSKKYEKKENVVKSWNIPQYDDPFNGSGELCMKAWLRRELERAIAHNRACLLKERDILLKRGFRNADDFELWGE